MVNMLSTLTASALVAVSAISGVAAHGYMSSPPVRGIQKISYAIDSLKSPNWGGQLCRGEPAGTVTNVGSAVTLGFTITAPHVGMCTVYILDPDLTNSQQIAQKLDCAAPGKIEPWTITIPSTITGRKVIRWYWEAAHVTPHEPYENCADVNIGGSGNGSAPAPEASSSTSTSTAAPSATSAMSYPVSTGYPSSAAPAPTPAPAPSTSYPSSSAPAPSAGGSCSPNEFTCNSDGRLGQCDHGSFVWIKCSQGTTCRSKGSYYYCGF